MPTRKPIAASKRPPRNQPRLVYGEPPETGQSNGGFTNQERNQQLDDTSKLDILRVEHPRFEQIPHWILFHNEATPNGIRLYLILRSFAMGKEYAFPSRKVLAGAMNVSIPTLYAARKNLVDIGAITVEERRSKAGDQTSNLYWVHWDQPDDGVKKVTHPPVNNFDTPLENNLYPNTYKPKPDQTKQTRVQKPVTPVDDEGFDRFWQIYPRKAGKGAARTAWAKAITGVDPETIYAGAERYRDDPNRSEAYTAHPSTWLNNERWDDDPLPKREDTEAPRALTFMEQVSDEPCEHGEPRGAEKCPLCRSAR